MKKILVAVLIGGILFVSNLSAQNSDFGAKGGLNFSNMTVSGNNDENLKLGFHVGVFDKISISESFAIQPELLYSVKGFKYNFDNVVFADGEAKFNLRYIDLPVKLVYNLSPDFEFQFGPYVSYLLKAKVKTDAEVMDFFDIDSDGELDRANFRPIDMGLSAGLGFNLHPFLLGFNYNVGLTRVAKENRPAEEIIGDARNTVIQIYAGIRF